MGQFKARIIRNKSGELIQARPHFATFNEKHNACRSKVYIILYHRKFRQFIDTGLTLKEIALLSTVDYFYIKAKIGKWVSWGFVDRKGIRLSNGKPAFCYTIGTRGRHFVEDIIPADWLKTYVDEIKAQRSLIR